MPHKHHQPDTPSQLKSYQIRLQGHLGSHWQAWFEELSITRTESGDTLLTSPKIDQSALYGLLRQVRDLGLPLISVTRLDSHTGDASDVK